MPKKGELATICKNGHDLTLPGARSAPSPTRRGAGECRLCIVERSRAKRGSTKTGPPSRYKGDETARLAALAVGLKRCPECETAKPLDDFWNDRHNADGKGSYCKACASAAKKADYSARREELLLRAQARKFGVTVEWLTDTLAAQGGGCAICRQSCTSGRALAVDHDHETGVVRGLLCANCNRALGLLQDSPQIARAALGYLEAWKAGHGESVCGTGMSGTD